MSSAPPSTTRERAGDEHPALRERRRRVRRAEGRRRRHRLLWALGTLGVVVLAVWALTGPLLAVHGVSVRGYDRADRDRVVAALTGAGESGGMLSPPRARMEQAVAGFPWVEGITVVRHWPRSLGVQVTQARPLAYARGTDGRVVVVSRTGRVLEDGDGKMPLGWLALSESAPAVGARLDAGQTAALGFLAALEPAQAAAIADLQVTQDGLLMARVVDGPQLRLGHPTRLAAKATAALLVLSALSADERARADYIDLSVPEHPAVGRLGESPQDSSEADQNGAFDAGRVDGDPTSTDPGSDSQGDTGLSHGTE
ncbi:MAG TPA: FtsQ-type POTRA domain-containing protein [Miltoncostaeaceae bacterium]|nr:FtsQ-type POTRA domain-containing protein [Miltoncostaeaceae bacterium]